MSVTTFINVNCNQSGRSYFVTVLKIDLYRLQEIENCIVMKLKDYNNTNFKINFCTYSNLKFIFKPLAAVGK